MADAAIIAVGILRILMAGRLMVRCWLGVLHRLDIVHVMLVLLDNGRMAITTHCLHGNRHGQRVATEQRQPDGYGYRNKFSDEMQHVHSLAKLDSPVKCKVQSIRPVMANKVRLCSLRRGYRMLRIAHPPLLTDLPGNACPGRKVSV